MVKISRTALGKSLKSLSGKTDVIDKTAVAEATKAAALHATWVDHGQLSIPVSGQVAAWPKQDRQVDATDDTEKVSHSTAEFRKNEDIVPMQKKELRRLKLESSERLGS